MTDILIAEDDENDLFLISRALSKLDKNVSVGTACDGQEAIDRFQEQRAGEPNVKLLVLDLKMPRMDGFQVLTWLQQHPQRRPSRIVVLTSSVDPGDSQRSLALGADLHLTKPHDARDFARVAGCLLEQLALPAAFP